MLRLWTDGAFVICLMDCQSGGQEVAIISVVENLEVNDSIEIGRFLCI